MFLFRKKTGAGRHLLYEKYQKALLIIILILICEAANYYSHFVLHSELLFSHIFYIPIVLACFWWIKRGIWVAIFLAATYIALNLLSGLNTALALIIFRSSMFIGAGITVAFLRDQALRSERNLYVMCDYLDNLMKFANSPIIIWNPASRITHFNRAFENLSGYSADEVIGANLDILFPESTREKSLRIIDRALSGEFWESVEITIQCKDGKTRTAIWNSANIYDDKGNVLVATIAQGQDITERIIAYDALRTSEELYRTMVEQSNDMIWTLDMKGDFVFFNKRAEEISGHNLEEWLGRSFAPLIEKEDLPRVSEIFSRTLNGEPQHYDVRVKKDTGDIITLSVNTAPIMKEGEVTGTVSFGRDITERKKAAEALKESEEKYRVLFEAAKDAIFLSDESGKFIDVNKAACESLGYSKEELLKLGNSDIDADSRGVEAFSRVRDGKAKEALFEVNQCRKDGTLLPREITGSMYYSAGTLTFLAIARDISERIKLEEQLRQSHKMEAIGTMAGGVAHDFNNLLVPILGFTELVISDLPMESRAREDLNHVLDSGKRAKKLVNQILTFSRKSEVPLQPVNMVLIVEEAVGLINHSLPPTIEIRRHIEPNISTVNADPTQIHQILMNLCTNAEHAMPEGGILEISLANVEVDEELKGEFNGLAAASYVRLAVKDTGCGMSKKTIKRIFDPFFTTKAKELGTGLGLSVVQGIVKSHNGSITVQSEIGSGSNFIILLPAVQNVSVVSAASNAPVLRGTESILFVDNEPAIAEMGKRTLERLGYSVATRTSSKEALELIRLDPEKFDLVITDQTMPHMTGVDLAVEILKVRPDIPIILCTGYSQKMTSKKAHASGIRKLIMKPLVGAELGHTVREVLDKSQ